MSHKTKLHIHFTALFLSLASPLLAQQPVGTQVQINPDQVLLVNGRKIFPVGFTMPPKPDATTPDGKNGIQELHDAGATFFRTGPSGNGNWDDKYIQIERQYMDAAARHGMYCLPWLKELSALDDKHPAREQMLRKVINTFKDHPGMGCWKGEDEPEWGKKPIPPMQKAYDLIKQLDPNHPVWIVEAPRGTIDSLRPYMPTRDITGQDIYPISYPPGIHSLLPNRDISLVGDHTQIIKAAAEGKKPIWMTLQIAWSGVAKSERTLRFPTFHEERFMTYQAIINGARGIIYFGGNLPSTLNERDAKLGWNWTFWNSVLRPVVEQIGTNSPLHAVLVAPDLPEEKNKVVAKLAGVSFGEAKEIEFLVRQVESHLYILACNRGRETLHVAFDNLPASAGTGEVMFESPRKVILHPATNPETNEGEKGRTTTCRFNDWFSPFEVHVYKLQIK
ncbi:MAG TPA: hypothetical protein VF669_22285 [Tepidisphaeraceae bacterium]|jgi:hypothetical protein